jgi:hypothetical protein
METWCNYSFQYAVCCFSVPRRHFSEYICVIHKGISSCSDCLFWMVVCSTTASFGIIKLWTQVPPCQSHHRAALIACFKSWPLAWSISTCSVLGFSYASIAYGDYIGSNLLLQSDSTV